MIPLTHFINSNYHSMFLVHLVLHYNELDSLNYANEKNGKTYESFFNVTDHIFCLVFSKLSKSQKACALYSDLALR